MEVPTASRAARKGADQPCLGEETILRDAFLQGLPGFGRSQRNIRKGGEGQEASATIPRQWEPTGSLLSFSYLLKNS